MSPPVRGARVVVPLGKRVVTGIAVADAADQVIVELRSRFRDAAILALM